MRRQVIASLAAAVVLLLSQAPARSATLVFLPGSAGGPAPSADAISGDGTVAAGSRVVPGQGLHVFRWTRDGGTVALGRPLGRDFNLVADVSDDGGTIVGWAYNELETGGTLEAFRWTQAGGFSSLGTVPGFTHTTVNGVSADGAVAVGSVLNSEPTAVPEVATRWTAGTGTVALPLPAGQTGSVAFDISGDGAVAVGALFDSSGNVRAARWTAARAEVLAGMPAGDSNARAASGDGTVVAGVAEGARPGDQELFRWTESGGFQRLGDLPGGRVGAVPKGISADGSIIAGNSAGASGSGEGFVWDAAHGMRTLKDILTASGIDTGSTRFGITDLSADGTTVVGYTNDSRAFVAVIPEPTGLTAGVFLLVLAACRRRGRPAVHAGTPPTDET